MSNLPSSVHQPSGNLLPLESATAEQNGNHPGAIDSDGQSDGSLQYHPLANFFPLIEGEEFEQLCRSIREDGLHMVDAPPLPQEWISK